MLTEQKKRKEEEENQQEAANAMTEKIKKKADIKK